MSNLATIKADSRMGPVATTELLGRSLNIGGNLQGFNNGTIGQYCYDATTANATAALPTETLNDGRTVVPLQRDYITIGNTNASAKLWYAFGIGAAPTLVAGQLSAFGTGHVSAGDWIAPGAKEDVIVPPGATHLAWILDAGASASLITIRCSEGNVGK